MTSGAHLSSPSSSPFFSSLPDPRVNPPRQAGTSCPGPADLATAVLAARAGRIELARSLLQKTGGAIDGLPGAILLSGSLDYAEGKFEQASAMWRGLARQQPLNVGVRRLLGAALLRSGDPRAALDMLRRVKSRYNNYYL